MRRRIASLATLALAAVAVALPAHPVEAQSGRGFLFGAPRGSFTLRAGYALPSASSAVFDDAISLLTIDKGDFSGFDWGGDISYSPSPRFDIVFDGEVSSSNHNSEFRDWVDNNDRPIEQSTKFRRIPLTLGMRYYLTERGRQVSQFAYIPNRVATYVGAGAGAMHYRFKQEGDFVDFVDNTVRPLTIEGSGWTPMAHGMAGVDFTVGPWFALVFEGRYQWAKATLDPEVFQGGYDKIDLTGLTGTVGFKVRF